MSKASKAILITVIAVAVVVSTFVIVFIIVPFAQFMMLTPDKVYEANWNIDLPDNYRAEYEVSTPASFHGDGTTYTVFRSTNSRADIEIFISDFSSSPSTDMEREVDDLLSELPVDDEFKIDFEKQYLWKKLTKDDNDRLYIIYDVITEKLYFVQELI